MKDLNYREEELNMKFFLRLLSRKSKFVYDDGNKLYNVYWTYVDSVDDRCISMLDLGYVRYNDLINTNIKPFKKD